MQLLNRLEKRRKTDPMLDEDICLLKQQTKKNAQEGETGEEVTDDLHIYAGNKEVNDHNCMILHRMCSDIVKLEHKILTESHDQVVWREKVLIRAFLESSLSWSTCSCHAFKEYLCL